MTLSDAMKIELENWGDDIIEKVDNLISEELNPEDLYDIVDHNDLVDEGYDYVISYIKKRF